MKKSTITLALAAALLSVSVAQASEFEGGWIGAKAGSNRSDVSGTNALDKQRANTYGVEGGNNWDMSGYSLGLAGFLDSNRDATHNAGTVNSTLYGSTVYGLDAKLGLPMGNWLPYAKLGYARTAGNRAKNAFGANGAHLGLGVEYKFAPQWSLAGEYTSATAKNNGDKMTNNNFTLGINYYFGKPVVAAPVAVAAVAAPVVVKQEVKPAAVVAPTPVYKTIFTDKPVTIEGTNFDTDSAKLKPAADKKLAEVVDFTVKYPESNLAVTGYTDSTGKVAHNQKLSERRAASVKAYLVKKGVPEAHIVTKGEGVANPVASNKTKAGRAQNRRVEITSVVREESKVRVNQ